MNIQSISTLAAASRSLAVGTALCAALAAQAVPITYTFSGTAAGTLGSTSFSANALQVTISTDTSNIDGTRFGANIPATANLVSGSISITGVGSGSFTQALYVFNNQSTQTLGFGNLASNDLVNMNNSSAGLASYGLITNLSFADTPPAFVSQFQNIATSFGTLSLSRLDNGTFNATVTAVPEPGSYALMGAGLACIVALARRRPSA